MPSMAPLIGEGDQISKIGLNYILDSTLEAELVQQTIMQLHHTTHHSSAYTAGDRPAELGGVVAH